jgi:phage regulator Rha-like protein
MNGIISEGRVENKIFLIRGQKVMLDSDLAELYGVPTKRLNEAIKRNIRRFPEEFMFTLTQEEAKSLRSQFATSIRGGRRYLPYAFTEQGVAMLSSVLRSERAIQINILIIKTFVRLRQVLATHKELAIKFKELEQKVGQHGEQIQAIFDVIKEMLAVPEKPEKKMGFVVAK